MKRTLSLLLCLVMLLTITACTGDKVSKTSGDIPTLTWYVHGDKQPDIDSVLAEANKIIEEKIGANLDLQFIDQGSYTEKMTMMMAAGEEFDLCFTGYVNTYENAVQRGGLLKLDEYLDKMPEFKMTIPDYAWEATRFDDGIYAIPNLQIMAFSLNMFTFKELADKYGFNDIEFTNVADAEAYLEKIKQNEPDYFPFRNNYGANCFYDECRDDMIAGTQVFAFYDKGSKDIKIEPYAYTDTYKDAQDTLRRWYKKGYIRNDIASVGDDTSDHMMGRYATWIEKYKPGILDELELRYGKEVVCAPVMNTFLPSVRPDAMTGVSKTSKHPELALRLIELMNTDKELYNLISYGIEGKHYKLDSEDKVEYIENSGYAPKAAWKFGNQFNAYLLKGQEEGIWEETRDMNDNSLHSPLLGFSVDTKNIKNEMAQVSSVYKEFSMAGKGICDLDEYYGELSAKLKTAGIDKITDEIKKQYEEWKKNN